MFESSQRKQLKRKSKPFPLINLIRGNSTTRQSNEDNKKELGSGITTPIILNSMTKFNDPYMPHINHRSNTSSTSLPSKHHSHKHPVRRSVNSSTPHLVTQSYQQPVTPPSPLESSPHQHSYYNSSNDSINQHHNFYNLNHHNNSSSSNHSSNTQMPPLSPPPLSPTSLSFAATNSRPSWRDTKRSPTWQPASSISSSELEDDDDEPLGLLKPFSLLSDASEDDEDLIPIAHLSISSTPRLSPAEKYKAKVRARLQMSDNNEILF